ncbi:MAG: UDP-N-acetylmuramoylalanine-D-glutamate ligase [Candidatus Gottesmanbacteria bacterium GW2011_GWA2_41_12]|uniref:UDP-N-acetylmuramoylalanine-D-glutamate ligase n=1 Tax=Candidatus Gottesmanbacteria bacterium GW2011_GWA2_41_12 TaxID=1618440 RepID=A0A0G0WW10_9BACT|nr:MAG: UDP-N-acetylmuramoylalanine-D-glutamate ligase [Candidatus Gottesmanbacteria bacterium GW2011_GWA2_41_12]
MNIDKFRNKKIHIVGITGVEGSAVLEFLLKHGITDITGHDFIKSEEIEKSFKIWHKGIGKIQRNKEFQSFKEDVNKIKYYFKKDYLKDINSADIIFVSQNWYSYSQNRILHDLKSKTPFYSMTRLYLELSPAITVGVTGTVGKGSVSHLLIQILEKAGKKVYFGGNDTWSDQVLDKLDEMKSDDILILEISHRQLLADFSKSPHIAVITNIFPNHLDEMPFFISVLKTYM